MSVVQRHFSVSIRVKTAAVCGSLSIISVAALLFVARSAEECRASIARQRDALVRLDVVEDIGRSFGSMRYWLTDLSVSWLADSEGSAQAQRDIMDALLVELERSDPETTAFIRSRTEKLVTTMKASVDA